jgi:hypothetical protein
MSFLIILHFGQDFHATLDVGDGGAVTASRRLLTMSRSQAFVYEDELTSMHANKIQHIKHTSIAGRSCCESDLTSMLIA